MSDQVDEYIKVIQTVENYGCSIQYPVFLPDTSELPPTVEIARTLSVPANVPSPLTTAIADWEFKHITLPRFLKSFSYCPVSNIHELIKFNEDNKDKAMPERKLWHAIIPANKPANGFQSIHGAKRSHQVNEYRHES